MEIWGKNTKGLVCQSAGPHVNPVTFACEAVVLSSKSVTFSALITIYICKLNMWFYRMVYEVTAH